ncbi:MAG: sarcosine oxidase subunit delta [Alphaproteobacteria bacterium]|nr:sarcosine oxidase subunit delta [Alphaproteobacteria bacterium]
MIIDHPLLGPRDSAEFTYMGDASLMMRPDGMTKDGRAKDTAKETARAFYEYGYLRDNPAGRHQELWFHEQGDRSWLVVTRDTTTHEITAVELACDVARARGRSS